MRPRCKKMFCKKTWVESFVKRTCVDTSIFLIEDFLSKPLTKSFVYEAY
jgi:hypothetical protein